MVKSADLERLERRIIELEQKLNAVLALLLEDEEEEFMALEDVFPDIPFN